MNENEEWISLGDLMGGVIAVLIILLVSSQIKNSKNVLDDSIIILETKIKEHKLKDIIRIGEDRRTLIFNEVIFDRSSACIKNEKLAEIDSSLKTIFQTFLEKDGNLIFIEGHSDSTPVARKMTNCDVYCGCYDDNLTLSALRARSLRQHIVKNLPAYLSKKTAIAGFGAENPLKDSAPSDSKNRRVEIRLINSK